MANRKKRNPGPQRHAEGQHGKKTHRRLIEQLQQPGTPREPRIGAPVDGHHRLHQDREQHDEAEKNSEKTRAVVQIERGDTDENVIAHARVTPEDLKPKR